MKHLDYSRCTPQRILISQLKLFNNPTYKRVNFILAALIFLGQNIPESIRQVDLSLVATIPPVLLPSIVIALKLDFGSIEPRFHRTTQNRPQARFISPVIKVIDKCIEAVKENPIERGLPSFRDKVQEKP